MTRVTQFTLTKQPTAIILNLSEIIRLTEYARAIVSRFHLANFPRGIIVILRH